LVLPQKERINDSSELRFILNSRLILSQQQDRGQDAHLAKRLKLFRSRSFKKITKNIAPAGIPVLCAVFMIGLLYHVVHAYEFDEQADNGETYEVYNLRTSVVLARQMTDQFTKSIGGGPMLADESSLRPLAGTEYGEKALYTTPRLQPSIYIVQDGDTLSDIAEMFRVSVDTIKGSNNIPGSIGEGDVLIILPSDGVIHEVQSGETLSEIAEQYSVKSSIILEHNNVQADEIAPGDELIIPGGKLGADVKKVKKSSASSNTSSEVKKSSTSTGYIRPIRGGVRTQGIHGYNAVDFGAPVGTSILAAASGEVIVSKQSGWNGGYGTYIVIAHSNGTQTLYAHNSRNIVGVGDKVIQGQVIGYVGNTGKSTGPHLHFELRGATNPF
jgi:LysM repeat protein